MHISDYIERYGEDPRDLDPENAQCNDCSHRFHVRTRPATRLEPAEIIGPEECPECGSDDWDFD